MLFVYALSSTFIPAAQRSQLQKPTLSKANQLHVISESLISEYGAHGLGKSVRFDALAQLDNIEHIVVKELLEGVFLKYPARHLAGSAV